MTKFAELGGCWLNLDQIRSFNCCGNGLRVTWANGDEEILSLAKGEYIPSGEDKYFVVAANPGFELLTVFFDEADPDAEENLHRTPVVAWRINDWQTEPETGDRGIIAISPDTNSAENTENLRIGVRHPDGVISHYRNYRVWPSTEAWLEWAREDYWEKVARERVREKAERARALAKAEAAE